jgi:antitoxin (DNA-binding transcriptional repressor) of toxin-antitoxin stability system
MNQTLCYSENLTIKFFMPPALQVSITDASRNFSDFINRVAYRQESFFLIRGKRPVAELRPVAAGRRVAEAAALLAAQPALSAADTRGLLRDLEKTRASR